MEALTIQDEDEKKKPSAENGTVCNTGDWNTAFDNEENRVVPSSILALLDDRNRSISLLKQQVENQKLQLGFYLHKELSNPKIIALAGTCAQDEVEENIQVNLAMNKFCKESGLNSKIMWLHQRMQHVETRTSRILDQQEEMLKDIVNKLHEVSHNSSKDGGIVEYMLVNWKDNSTALEVLRKIVSATGKLRKELDTFRTCCSRLIVIEDERNNLAQYEKLRLEKEVQEIRQDQKMLQQRLATLTPQNSRTESDCRAVSTPGDQSDLQKMLNTVNAEAISLLAMAKAQRDKYLEEISNLKGVNDNLSAQISSLQEGIQEKDLLESKVEEMLRDHDTFKEQSCNKLNELYDKLQTLVDENSDLKKRLDQFYDIQEQVKFLRTQIDDMDTIRRQRDYFKSQVDDLQAIRAAYSQLVEQPMTITRDADLEIQEQAKKIEEMEHQQERMESEMKCLEEIASDQESQIKQLVTIIYKLGQYKEPGNTETHRQLVNMRHNNANTKNANKYGIDSHNMHSPSDEVSQFYSCTERSPSLNMSTTPFSTPRNSFHEEYADKATMCCLVGDEDIQNEVLPVYHSKIKNSSSLLLKDSLTDTMNCGEKTFTQTFLSVKPLLSTTSVQVQSTNRKGKSESMKAILQSSTPLDGIIQMNNSTALTLRLTCNPKNENNGKQTKTQGVIPNQHLTPIVSEQELVSKTREAQIRTPIDYSSPDLDEFELMKDSSKETLPTTTPSVHHQIGDTVQVRQQVKVSKTQLAMQSSIGILHKANDEARFSVSRESVTRPCASDYSDSEFEFNNTGIENDRTVIKSDDTALAIAGDKALVTTTDRALTRRGDNRNLSGCLKHLTNYLDQTLSTPGGKDIILKSVKNMYDAVFADSGRNKLTAGNDKQY